MKMPQEKNGEYTDLKCDLVAYCAETWTLRKEDITRLETFEMRMAQDGEDQLDRAHIK